MKLYYRWIVLLLAALYLAGAADAQAVEPDVADYANPPMFLTADVPPLVMLVMGRDHKLYYEAYNDASDLDEDGNLDVGFDPSIDYYGYFDCYKCYEYNSSNSRFEPLSVTADKKCTNAWSGNFLNYATMSRMDTLRKVLYGGRRSTDTATETVLERAYIPKDAHSWGKEYHSIARDGYDISDYTPLSEPQGGTYHQFVSTTLSDAGDPLMRVLENTIYRVWEWVSIERPVASDRALHGGSGPSITDNGATGDPEDVTLGGSAGTASDNAAGGTTTTDDDFDDDSLDAMWTTADHDTDPGTTFQETGQELVITAAGADVWTSSDEFGVVYLDDVTGNFDVRVQVTQQQNTNEWAKCGIMVRNDMTQPGSSTGYCIMGVTPGNGHSFQYDNNDNGFLDSHVTNTGVSLPRWVRLTKVGTTFTAYRSGDGVNWTEHTTQTISSAATTQDVGLFVTSHSGGNLSECHFDNFYMEQTANADPAFAFDDNTSTKWLIADEPSLADPACIQFAFDSAQRVLKYTITTANDAEGRDPRTWILAGSNNEVDWTEIDTVVNGALPADREEETEFICSNPPGDNETYIYYRLCISDTKDAGVPGVQIGEIEFLTSLDPVPATATLTDYVVRVQVGVASMPEENAKMYGEGASAVYKPIGLLQRHGENERMYFGLITGSYAKNTSGGVLRKGIRSIADEINLTTGQFTSVNGILNTIDTLRIVDFSYSNNSYNSNCGWITTRPINEGECRMWGNPLAEMMYEGLRYFGGKSAGTADYDYSSGDDVDLGLPKDSWIDPYDPSIGYGKCAQAVMLVMSDVNPSFDSDQLPGVDSNFGSFSAALEDHSGGPDLDVATLADVISAQEGISGNYFIGQQDTTYDGACTEKSVSGFGDIRGLCPEEPTKKGSYYSAAVAYFGQTADISAEEDNQTVMTYAVGLSSPLPRIEIPFPGQTVTLVPFAKSVGGSSISAARGSFQPTNTIVDFYVDVIEPTYGRFRINYEDVEQGADHDMDAIAFYEYQLVDAAGDPTDNASLAVGIDVTLTSEYAAGGIAQHMGYIISGTTQDGIYLEIRDCDTANPAGVDPCDGNNPSTDPDYFLDTPPGIGPNQGAGDTNWDDDAPLPLQTTRNFTPAPAGTGSANLLENPLWFAGKYGGFDDKNNNDLPDLQEEWDDDADGVPDNYYYVVNPLKLEEELNRTFADILKRTGSGTSVSVLATKGEGEGTLVQAYFKPKVTGPSALYDVIWVGYLQSLWIDRYGNTREDSNHNYTLDLYEDDIVRFYLDNNETRFRRYEVTVDDPYAENNPAVDDFPLDDLEPIWEAGELLALQPESQRKIFTYIGPGTELEPDTNKIEFNEMNIDQIKSYLGVEDSAWDYLGTSYEDRAANLIRFVRGVEDDDPPSVYNYEPGHQIRPRKLELSDASLATWKLGDIVYSTPLSISKPVENYGLLYDDDSYKNYYGMYRDRETVVYVGANDGMIHAFTSGVFRLEDQKFYSIHDVDSGYNLSEIPDTLGIGDVPLGSELWAYIPQNLLPHLKFLPDRDYPHVSYVDLRPKVVDAKVFADDGTHPEGWGTILIGGLNMGGKQISTASAGTFKPCFFAIDITNPRNPVLMWEKTYTGLGFASNEPAVIKVEDEWMLAIGSGPTDFDGSSTQNAKVFIVDLATGTLLQTFTAAEGSSVMNAPVALDKGLNFNVDAIFAGATYPDAGSLKAKVYRVTVPQTGSDFDPAADAEYIPDPTDSKWNMVRVFDSPRPLSAPFSLSVDKFDNNWIFCGTGRYIETSDKTNTDQNYIFGLKDPFFNPDNNTTCYGHYPAVECELTTADLFNAELFKDQIHSTGQIDPVNIDGETVDSFSELLNQARKDDYRGWYRYMCQGRTDEDGNCYPAGPSERNISKPSVLGGIVLVPSFSPNEDICGFGGNGRLFALYYETGTSYQRRIVGAMDQDIVLDVVSLGEGLPSSFGIHVGLEEGGTLYSQDSTGKILQIDITPAFNPKSAPIYWREEP